MHVRRKANKVVYLLANKGVQDKHTFQELNPDDTQDIHLILSCRDLVARDLSQLNSPDGGGK